MIAGRPLAIRLAAVLAAVVVVVLVLAGIVVNQAASRSLDETLNERDTFVTSALARSAKRATDHFAARDAAGEDRIELWGRRIGRALSLAGFVALAIYLYVTYLAK